MNFYDNIILQNDVVLLRPLEKADYELFKCIAFNPDIWKHSVTSASNENELHSWIDDALESKKNNQRYPLTIVDKKSERVFGSTSIGNISLKDKRAEIGWTWLGLEFQGTGINKYCKLLLLQYLLDELSFERVEFKTDALNLKSRKALQKNRCKRRGHFKKSYSNARWEKKGYCLL